MWQATRKLVSAEGAPVEVAIGFPRAPEADEPMWQCAVRLVVDGREEIKSAFGVDAFQALQMAFEQVYADTKGWTQEGFPQGYSGFFETLMLDPLVYDVAKISRMVAEEVERQSAELENARGTKGR